MDRFFCFAHRGASGHEPENTLLAFETAIEMGAPWIELDVYSVLGFLFVIHSDNLAESTDGFGSLLEQPLAYSRSLDVGKGQRIPLLREVFTLVRRRAGLNIELKGTDTAGPVVRMIKEFVVCEEWTYDGILVSSHHHHEIERVRELDPKIKIGVLVNKENPRYERIADTVDAYSIHPHISLVDSRMIKNAHKKGRKVFVYTVDDPSEMAKMESMGVDGIFTNYPDRFAAWSKRKSVNTA